MSPSTSACAGHGAAIVSTWATKASAGSSAAPTTRLSRPISLRTRRTGSDQSAHRASIRSTIRPSAPDGDGIPTSSASRSRASATAAAVGAQPLCTSCQARTQVSKLSGWTSAIASEIERGSAVSRNLAGTSATAAALTTAKPFWAAIACAGFETK